MWSSDNIYSKANGGMYDFITEAPLAIPNDQRLWDDLMANASEWGMVVCVWRLLLRLLLLCRVKLLGGIAERLALMPL